MSKYKIVSYLFILLGLLVIAGSAYVIIAYASDLLRAIVDFVTTTDFTKLQQCGVSAPPQFNQVKADLTTMILPFLYLGLPLLLVVISALMFLGGFYFHKGKHEDDTKKSEELERQMVHKIVSKMESEKPAGQKKAAEAPPAAPVRPQPKKQADPDDEEPEEPEPGDEEPTEEEEPEDEDLPPPKTALKKRR